MATAKIKSFSIKDNDLDWELDHNLAVVSFPSFISKSVYALATEARSFALAVVSNYKTHRIPIALE